MVEKHTSKRKKIIPVLLIAVLIIAGVFAFMTATDTKDNVFTIGKVKIELHEDDWYNDDGTVKNDDNNNGIPDFAENIMPGDKVVKAPYVENKGNNDAYVYLVVEMPTSSMDDISVDADGNIAVAETMSTIKITAYAIQSGYVTEGTETSDSVWNKYVTSNGGMEAMFGAERSEDEYELFELLTANNDGTSYTPGVNVSAWKQKGAEYRTEGENIYVYKYALNNGLLPFNNGTNDDYISNTLFDAVALTSDIGEDSADMTRGMVTFRDGEDDIVTMAYSDIGASFVTPPITNGVWVTQGGEVLNGNESFTPEDTIVYQTDGGIDSTDITVRAIHSGTNLPKLLPAGSVHKITGPSRIDETVTDQSRTMIQRSRVVNGEVDVYVETYNLYGSVPGTTAETYNNIAVKDAGGLPLYGENAVSIVGVNTIKVPDNITYTNPGNYSNYYIYGLAKGFGRFVKVSALTTEEAARATADGIDPDVAKYSTKYSSVLADKLSYWFEIYGNGYIVLEPIRKHSTTLGTGTKLYLYDSSDNLVEMFTLLFPGDVNGDCNINGEDYVEIKYMRQYGEQYFGKYAVPKIAYDVDGDGYLTFGDVEVIFEAYVAIKGKPDPVTLKIVGVDGMGGAFELPYIAQLEIYYYKTEESVTPLEEQYSEWSKTTDESTFTITSTVPTMDDYSFVGWKGDNGIIYHAGDVITVTEQEQLENPYKLYAQWEPV